jgi:single-strand DNA-binding protein
MFNQVILVGNLGGDPELRYTASGIAVCNFSLATSRKWTSKDNQPQEETQWHRCVAWAKTAEVCNRYLSKGKQVFVQGEIRYETYQAEDGTNRYSTKIHIREMKMLGRRDEGYSATAAAAPAEDKMDESDIPF